MNRQGIHALNIAEKATIGGYGDHGGMVLAGGAVFIERPFDHIAIFPRWQLGLKLTGQRYRLRG
jgi:hypothetical protein